MGHGKRWGLLLAAGLALATLIPDAQSSECVHRLWPAKVDQPAATFASSIPPDLLARILNKATIDAKRTPAPVRRLASAGISKPDDPELVESRRAFGDSDRAVILALAWRATSNQPWLDGATRILLAWSNVNHPTGHPIDETRLDGMLWAYDLIRCQLQFADRTAIENWFSQMREAKRRWVFGERTALNNHRTHQLKMLIALQALLSPGELAELRSQATGHASTNLPSPEGVSRDFTERGALRYHVYNLEAWIEIALTGACCEDAVERAYAFMLARLRDHPDATEFENSSAPIDRERAQAGFSYAQRRSYDVARTERVMTGYATMHSRKSSVAFPDSHRISSGQLWRLARLHLWEPRQ
jgi:Alginate lyase